MCPFPNVSTLTPYIGAAATVAGVLIGFGLSRIPASRDRKRKATGYFHGIDAEIDYAIRHAKLYVEGENGQRYVAPAYRLLTRFSIDGTAWLTSEGFIARAEIESLLAFLAGADEFNRCLEEVAKFAAESLTLADFEARSHCVLRATTKAQNLCDGEPPKGVAVIAREAIRAAAGRAGFKLAD